MINRGDKHGSHVGVIASFAIFVLFLIGIYLVTEPALKTEKDKKLLLEYIKSGLVNEFSSDLTTAVVYPTGNCINLSNSDVEVSGVGAIVKDVNGRFIASNYFGSTLIINLTMPFPPSMVWIYYSKEFPNITGTNAGCNSPSIASIRESKEIFESKILNGISNFETLKTDLKIPAGSEFSLAFDYSNGTRISSLEKNVSSEVYAEEVFIGYIDKNADRLSGKLIIKTW